VIIELIGLAVIAWLISQTRTKKMYVGFSVLWFVFVISLMIIIAIPSLASVVGFLLGIKDPMLAIICIICISGVIVLIYLTKQISIIANRVIDIAQYIAMERDEQENKILGKEKV
jgi:hypothetical protein